MQIQLFFADLNQYQLNKTARYNTTKTTTNMSSLSIDTAPMQPLDLIAFRGTDNISQIVRKLEKYICGNGEFSHVGILVNRDLLPGVEEMVEGEWYVWESTISFSSDAKDIQDGRGHLGVQLRNLKDVVKSYTSNGKNSVAWCALKDNPWQYEAQRDHLRYTVTNVFNEYQHDLYQVDAISMVASLFPQFRKLRNFSDYVIASVEHVGGKVLKRSDSKEFLHKCKKLTIDDYNLLHGQSSWKFCSELVADVYQRIGRFPADKPTNDVVPVDFFGDHVDNIPALVDTPIDIHAEVPFVF